MSKSLKYFMRDIEDEIITVPGPPSFKDENGNVIEFEVKVLSSAEIQKINENYRKRAIATDKKGNPYINGGQIVYKVDSDGARASRHLIAEALVYPNLKDPELMAHYNCADITEMPRLVFSRADEFSFVTNIVMVALGLRDAVTDEEELSEAKNS